MNGEEEKTEHRTRYQTSPVLNVYIKYIFETIYKGLI
jgi:hypothetical protein